MTLEKRQEELRAPKNAHIKVKEGEGKEINPVKNGGKRRIRTSFKGRQDHFM